ncbi:hypothetical protein BC833DRAFT_645098 [Globomyces pollinis-pini]|nr:hypothetical protein BC833DRAFT_645098 [Globomyces pollinis-pini]
MEEFQFEDEFFEIEDKRQRHFIDTNYCPEVATLGGFQQPTESLFNSENGPSKIQNLIEYMYLKKQYIEAWDLCQQWFLYNRSLQKSFKDGQLLEISIRLNIKLDDVKTALDLTNQFSEANSKEAGVIFLKGHVYLLNSLFNDALKQLRLYLESRTQDYKAWIEIAHVFVKASKQSGPEYGLSFRQWAYLALKNSLYFIERSPRPTTVYKEIHIQQEVETLKLELASLQIDSFSENLDSSILQLLKVDEETSNWLLQHIRVTMDEEPINRT